MEKKGSYIGRIKNTGTQIVEAPNQHKHEPGGTVIKGKDLRSGK